MARYDKSTTRWAFIITSLGLFITVLDNLVVSTALPVIRKDLHAGITQLEWTVNAYTLTYAVFLLTGAALGDRFGTNRAYRPCMSQEKATLPECTNHSTQTTMDVPPRAVYKFLKASPETQEGPCA